MSAVELAVEKVKGLSENDASELLGWLELRESRVKIRERLNSEIELGLQQLERGEKFAGEDVHTEIRRRSDEWRARANG